MFLVNMRKVTQKNMSGQKKQGLEQVRTTADTAFPLPALNSYLTLSHEVMAKHSLHKITRASHLSSLQVFIVISFFLHFLTVSQDIHLFLFCVLMNCILKHQIKGM